MSDPGSSLTQTLHKRLAQVTQLLDDHIRVVQYGVYGVAALGLWRVLHSARAFSHFTRIEDIPHDFIRKNVRLTGRVRSLGTEPVSASNRGGKDTASKTASVGLSRLLKSSSTASSTAASGTNLKAVTSATSLQTPPSGDTIDNRGNSPDESPPGIAPSSNPTTTTSPPENSSSVRNTVEVETFPRQESSISVADSGTADSTLETLVDEILTDKSTKETPVNLSSNRVDGPSDDSDLSNADYRSRNGLAQPRSERLPRDGYHDMGDLMPLFLEVEHVPVFGLPHHNPDQLLSLKVAAVEIPAAAFEVLSRRLTNKRAWFRPLYVDATSRTLVCAVTRNEFGFGAWRTLNEEIVRTGEGAVCRFADASDASPLTTSPTLRQRARAALRALWPGAPSAGALALVDDQQAAGQKVLLVIPVAYHKLYGKLLQSEAWARKKRLGLWKQEDSKEGVNLQRSFLVRLWNRFRNNTKEMKSKKD